MPMAHLGAMATSGNINALRTSLGTEATHRSLLKEDKVKAPMNSGSH